MDSGSPVPVSAAEESEPCAEKVGDDDYKCAHSDKKRWIASGWMEERWVDGNVVFGTKRQRKMVERLSPSERTPSTINTGPSTISTAWAAPSKTKSGAVSKTPMPSTISAGQSTTFVSAESTRPSSNTTIAACLSTPPAPSCALQMRSPMFYDEAVLGSTIDLKFDDNVFYRATITKYRVNLSKDGSRPRSHYLVFDDGQKGWFDIGAQHGSGWVKWPSQEETGSAETATHVAIHAATSTLALSKSFEGNRAETEPMVVEIRKGKVAWNEGSGVDMQQGDKNEARANVKLLLTRLRVVMPAMAVIGRVLLDHFRAQARASTARRLAAAEAAAALCAMVEDQKMDSDGPLGRFDLNESDDDAR